MADLTYKLDINPSYEWGEGAEGLGVSHRELEVFSLIVEGFSNKEAAQILHINHQSVKNHLYAMYKKLGVKNDMQALILLLHKNMVKAKAKMPLGNRAYVTDVKLEALIDHFRKLNSGEAWSSDINRKNIRLFKVWLREHGIDVENWENTDIETGE
ncbi:helix-turn-helix transcriptional regulator [Dehalogenimonas sp. THU2]|uniref:response regulator transcription factor n=1 Tax=Dehalogenimonas sp. THU2 TaxID=3151121 RepID=UPI0032185CC6